MSRRARSYHRGFASILILGIFIAAGQIGGEVYAQSGPVFWTDETIQSTVLGETRRLKVSLPQGYKNPEFEDQTYPVLIVLDAQFPDTFAMAPAASWGLGATDSPVIPRLIVVGIETTRPNRLRDMTPFFAAGESQGVGGAPAFLRFLSTELRPYLDTRYRTNSVTVIVGHSTTGLFAAWAFGQAPEFLAGAIALSPSLTFANGATRELALDSIKSRRKPGRLFLAVGDELPEMRQAAESLAMELKAKPVPGRDVHFEKIPDASHSNMPSLGLIPGLLFVFRPVSLGGNVMSQMGPLGEPAKLLQAFDAVRERYLHGARQLGLPERLPLPFLRTWSDGVPKTVGVAPFVLRVCEDIIASYPRVLLGYECAADAQARLGRVDDSAANYTRALEVARKMSDAAAVERIGKKLKEPRDQKDRNQSAKKP